MPRPRLMILAALLVVACAPAGPGVAPSPPPRASGAPPASAMPSPGPALPTAVLRGRVYDEQGAPLPAGSVRVKSLGGAAFEDGRPVTDGAFALSGAPVGVQLEVVASRPGWTPRTRLLVAVPGQDNVVDFGSPADAYDPEASAYGLSPYPEVTAVAPAFDALLPDGRLALTLTLSEPLDAGNRDRFARALRVLPASQAAAAGTSGALNLHGLPSTDYRASQAPYAIAEGTAFLGSPEVVAAVSWDAAGQVATFRFPAPLVAARLERARYQVVLVAAEGPIVDGEGNQLGTDGAGRRDRYPAEPEQVVNHAFRDPAMRLSAEAWARSALARWEAVHAHAAPFQVAADRQAPALESVAVRVVNGATRLTLRFSEPLAAYDGSREGLRQADLLRLDRFTFAAAETTADLDAVDMDGEDAVAIASATTGYDRREAFRLAEDGGVKAALDPADPAVVTFTIAHNPAFFASRLRAIKARVEGLADPAGNAVSEREADAGVKTGFIER